MKKFKIVVYSLSTIILLLLFVYLIQPISDFPQPIAESLQSSEPADIESSLRRSYFLNKNREEVISYYQSKLNDLPTFRLNYPPEDAQTIIRDQTRSSYLEEINQPFRLSLYINGFVPSVPKDRIFINDTVYSQKITVRYIPTSLTERMIFFMLVSSSTYLLIYASFVFSTEINKLWQKK